MKFEVNCCYDCAYTFVFVVYKDNVPVANTTVRLDKIPTFDEFEEEIAKPRVKQLKQSIIRNYMPCTFVGLEASKVHNKSEENESKNKAILRKQWQTFVTSIIRKAADKGEYEVCIGHLMPCDNLFEDGFDREIMLVETPKILQEKGFKVDVSVNKNNPKAFIMGIYW